MSKNSAKDYIRKKFKHKCCGAVDENGFLIKTNCYHWLTDNSSQKYYGQFLCNNLHNKAVYLIDKPGDQIYYDGLFFCNKFEGYGRVVYSDGSTFEGLFKQHIRFGPGVLTHTDSSQDVGIWDGFSLRRLIVPIGEDFVPRLSKTSLGKARLLKYRALVPICKKRTDLVREIFSELHVDEETLSKSDEIYNLHVRHEDSLFFNSNLYYNNFMPEDCTIDVLISEEEFEEHSRNSTKIATPVDLRIEPKSKCVCFDPFIDLFTHLASQMQEVELKLQNIKQQRVLIEEQIHRCKSCCDKMIQFRTRVSKRESQKEVIKAKFLISEHVVTLSNSSASASAEPNNETQDGVIKSEIELNHYFYTNSMIFNAFKKSRVNCEENPLGGTSVSFIYKDSFKRNVEYFDKIDYSQYIEEAGEESAIFEPICYCSRFLAENLDNLEFKVRKLQQEELFYNTVKKSIEKHLDAEFGKIQQLMQEQKRYIKKIPINELVAWNNEPIWISILQHSFYHRYSENYISFNVKDLLVGQRHYYQSPGIYEKNCRKFLESCAEGEEETVLNLIKNANINPDLCDCRGNTGVMLAAIRDKTNIISTLVNCGAKIDILNDDCLTPLTICFLKFISFKLKVSDWEKAFLADSVIDSSCSQWREVQSLISVYNEQLSKIQLLQDAQLEKEILNSTINSKIMKLDGSEKDQQYIFNFDYVRVPKVRKKAGKAKSNKEKKKKGEEKKKKQGKKTKQKNKVEEVLKIVEIDEKVNLEEEKINNKLNCIKKSIMTLLKYGADPNMARVPLDLIFLAVFTDDSELLKTTLEHGLDPNCTISEENLTSLHVLASLKLSAEKVKMAEILLSFGADPNITTSADHWEHLKSELKSDDLQNQGKNPLHLLTLREDFIYDTESYLCEFAKVLINGGCKPNSFYLDFTALSLAVFRGNVQMIEALLRSGKVDAHQILGNDMGNALTVLVLDRFKNRMPEDAKISIALTLFNNNLNPLHRIDKCGNALEFIEAELLKNRKLQKKSKKDKKKKKGKSLRAASKSKSKKSKTKKNETLDSFIRKKSKEILCRHLQAKAVEYLYILISAGLENDSLTEILNRFIKDTEPLDIIQMLFQNEIINFKWFNLQSVCNFLEFVKLKFKPNLSEEEKNKIHLEVNNREWQVLKIDPGAIYLPDPEVDRNVEKYQICFQCLKTSGRKLLLCPSCSLVYFCSEECNKLSNKSDNFHQCKILFYKSINQIIQDCVQPNRLEMLIKVGYKLINKKLESERLKMASLSKQSYKKSFTLLKKNTSSQVVQRISQDSQSLTLNSAMLIPMSVLSNFSKKNISAMGDLDRLEPILNSQLSTNMKTNSRNISAINSTNTDKRNSFRKIESMKTNDVVFNISNQQQTVKSLNSRKNMDKSRYYMELLSKIFADFNLPLILLPYACFKDGQVYYSMNGNKAYFGSDFAKINMSQK